MLVKLNKLLPPGSAHTTNRNARMFALALSLISPTLVNADVIQYTAEDPAICAKCQFLTDTYFPAVESYTDGDISIQPLFGGLIGTHHETVELVGNDVVKFGTTWVGAHPTVFIAQSIFDLFPIGPNRYEDQMYFYRQAYERIPAFKAELGKRNLELIMISPLLHLAFASKEPISELSGLEGKKFRAGNKWLLRYLATSGASPVSVPWADIYISLQTGVINGVLTNYDGIDNMKFYEPAPHLLMAPDLWMASPMIHVANKDYFDGLSPEVQDGWIKASLEAEDAFGEVMATERAKIIQSQTAAGVTITEMSEEDLQSWGDPDSLTEARTLWVEEASAAGLEDAQSVLDLAMEIYSETLTRSQN
ncbi:TRAP transporter substrate-binding protein [Roseovarius arcticus]|uniref:TRAP transporter substrate-binding protein n=1 Tax=Roseovarius arcticus TaxID=2547404 RepID=UPI00111031FB|nr:TRAP transporter substrate-binding protein DctP [Roseovarius arcticus]